MLNDTTAEAEKRQHEIFDRLSGEEKVRLAMEFSDAVRDIAWAGFCRRHPSVSEETLRVMFLEEVHGIELIREERIQETGERIQKSE
jgi:hypothetical protein